MQITHQEIDDGIVQKKIGSHHQTVSEQLHMPPQIRAVKNNIFRKVKSQRESYAKRHHQRSIVRPQGNKIQVNRLLIENKIETQKEKEYIQEHIAAPTNGVTKSLNWNYSPERRIKKIYNPEYYFPYRHWIIIKNNSRQPGPGKFINSILNYGSTYRNPIPKASVDPVFGAR